MGFKKENYTRMGLAIPVLIGLCLCVFIPQNIANSLNPPESCNIGALEEPRPTSRARGSVRATSSGHTYRNAPWEGLKNGRISDGEFISTTLDGGVSSACLSLNNFNFKLPDGAEITGMEILVEGNAQGDDIDVKTKKLQLLDASGNPMGHNLYNAASIGDDWKNGTGSNVWKYGSSTYDWDGILTRELINSSEFGLLLEVKNHSDQTAEVAIDKIQIIIHYKPGLSICLDNLHKCISFFGPKSADIISYNWTLPEGFRELDDDEPEVFNVFLTDSTKPGMYDICVDMVYSTGTEQCCRKFEVLDCTPSSIGDFVWEDLNGDGLQDDGEPGLEGVSLELFNDTDQLVGNAISGSDGSYSFDNIDSGCYYLKASGLNGYLPSIGSGNFLDGSNGYATTDYFTLDPGVSITNIDLGLVKPAIISGTIWHDVNANGSYEDEPLIEGITINLQGPDMSRTVVTDGSGNYIFDDLVPGDYMLSSSLLDNYEFTIAGVGAADVNSDVNSKGMIDVTGLISGSEINNIDAGMFKRGTIGNFVWYDYNVNGLQDDGEQGIPGVIVILNNADGVVARSTTNSLGEYSLNKVLPDTYFLTYEIDDEYIISLPNIGDDRSIDSNVETIQDQVRTQDFIFESCDSLWHTDAGFIFKPGTIRGQVWSDDNRDGQRQTDEAREIATTVTLYHDNDTEVASKQVDADGSYFFDQLQPGDFYVKFDAVEDHVYSMPNVGNDASDSDITDADNGTTDLISITPDITIENIDVGFEYLVSSISGTVWEDEDRDNKRSADENKFSGIVVNLFFGNDELVATTNTDADGNYTFEELRKNEYYLTFGQVEDYLFVTPFEGVASENSDISQSIVDGSTDIISLLADTDLADIDAGYVLEVGTIVGVAWEDIDLDASNNDQTSFEGIEVTLFDSDNTEVRKTNTDSDGAYMFDLVPVGDYYVHFELPDRYIYTESNGPVSEPQNSDINHANGEGTTEMVSLEKQDDEQELDGGYIINEGKLEGIVWKDNDEDGQRQESEPGMEGVSVTLHDNSGAEIASTGTNASGNYLFDEVTAGEYYIEVNIPDDNIFTPADQGDDATDSDITHDNGEGTTNSLEILTGRRVTNADAGSVDNFGNILGLAWCDANEDGILESTEELIGDIKVDLYTEEGVLVETSTTSADGAYSFLEVPAGTYYLVFEDETDKNFTTPGVGDDDLLNSSVNSSLVNGSTFVFRVGTGNKDYIRNAGYQYLPGSISGQAWKDDNTNATNDDNSAFDGISVSLFDSSNSEVNSTTTDASGNYNFQDIRRGDYYVVFGADENYLMITASQSNDSDITNSTVEGGTSIFEVIANRETTDIDAGYLYARGSVNGNAWIDVNDNGLDDDNDPFSGVEVTLFNAAGEVGSATTDVDGNYSFNDVYFGDYYVVFEAQQNYLFAQADAGDDTIDSDINGANGNGSTANFQVLPNTATTDIDGGYFLAVGSVSGTAWIDDNDNATNDEGKGFEGIEVTLFSSSGERTTTTTSGDGSYIFEDVLLGEYTLTFQTQADYDFVTPGQGEEDQDSDVTGSNGDGSTDPITVNPRIETMHVDAGYVLGKGTVSGTAWIDSNDNATNDDNNGFGGVEVALLTSSGERITTTTNDDGTYTFEDVFPGNYFLFFNAQDGYKFVTPNSGDDSIDSDVTGSNGEGSTDEITVSPREDVANVDAGYLLLTGSISGTAWADLNDNAINDDGAEVEGVEVTLLTSGGERTITRTNSEGVYMFDNVIPGTYSISFETRADFDFVTPNAGDEDQDSDVTGANGDGSTDEFSVLADQETANIDAGYKLATGTISGTAWMDINGNDINDDNMAFEGVEVTLLTASGERITTSTDADGNYRFEDVVPGVYSLAFEGRENYEFVAPNAGEDDQDSDVTGSNGDGSTDEFTVDPREDVMNVDAGYLMLKGGIAGSAWKDENGNGTYNSELPFANVMVTLFSEAGEEVASVNTNDNGNYMFDDLSEGNYYLVFASQDNYKFTIAGEGGEDEDSDVTGNNGEGSTDLVAVNPGEVAEGIDAGYVMTQGSICGLVWIDDNSRDGLNSDGDEFGAEVNVFLETEEGDLIQELFADEDGGYCFSNLPLGSYRVGFSLNDGQEFVAPKQGDDEGKDSDVTDTENGKTDLIELMDGDMPSYDAGIQTIIVKKGSIAGKVFRDNNLDNIYNEGDDLVEGLGINLLSDIGAILGTTATGPDGTYAFDDLEDGSYVVLFENKEVQNFVEGGVGEDRSIDSDVISTVDTTGSFGITNIILIEGGQDVVDIDAGVFIDMVLELGSISGTAFRDENKNNIDDDNSGLSGIEVVLFSTAGEELANTSTDDRGNYSFVDVNDGSYYVVFGDREDYEFAQANVGDDDAIDSDVTGSNGSGSTDPFEVIDGIDVENIDAGYFTELELYSIMGNAFIDADGNNINNDEAGLAGLQVALLDSLDVELAVTNTDADGNYAFNNLEANSYVVVFWQPMDREFVMANEGDDDTVDSDVEFVQDGFGATNIIVLTANVGNVDAGFTEIENVEKGSIAGSVWIDANGNNINDDNAPFADVEIILRDSTGAEVVTQFSDASGNYIFENLDDGDYYVFFDRKEEYTYSDANVGDDDLVDSEVTGANGDGTTDFYTIANQSKITDVDAGYYTDLELYSITGKAFIDADGNNVNNDEAGLAGLQVALLDSLDVELAVTTTDADGNYTFNNLEANSYVVVFWQPMDREFVMANEGDDDTVDSDVEFVQDGFGATNIIVLTANVGNIDAGFTEIENVEKGSIAGSLWIDANENNINDDDAPFADIEIILRDSTGTEVATQFSDASGNYIFENLDDGDYYVYFGIKGEYTYSDANVGDDDLVDSEVTETNGEGTTDIYTIVDQSVITDIDAGYKGEVIVEKGSIAGRLWFDDNKNNINDDSAPVEGVDVTLFTEDDVEVAVVTTDADGNYIFEELEAGGYYVSFEISNDYTYASANEGDNDDVDSDVTGANGDGTSDLYILEDGVKITSVDAGYISEISTYSISGKAWKDNDGNGVNDDASPLAGIVVILVDSLDAQTAITTTDELGNYTFGELEEGTYAVVFMLPVEHTFSAGNQGDDDTIDSDVEFIQDDLGATAAINLTGNVRNVDAGFIPDDIVVLGSISGLAFRDINSNHLSDDAAPFVGIEVKLLNENAETIKTTSTDGEGRYSFGDLENGTYIIQFETRENNEFSNENEGDDDTIDSDVTDGSGLTDLIVIADNANVENIDAGYITNQVLYAISGKTWIDVDRDNLNNDDAPFSGIQVFLIDSLDAEAATTMTDSLGCYTFENIVEGTYGVVFTLVEDYEFAEPNVGDDETIDSDVLFTQNNLGAAEKLVLTGDVANVDAGYVAVDSMMVATGGIEGNVWEDTTIDNIRQGDEAGVQNIEVLLLDASGEQVAMTSTDENGNYSFADVEVGAYTVRFTIGDKQTFVLADQGDDDTIDSDVIDGEGNTASVMVIADTTISNIDAGILTELPQASLCGFVWIENEQNGLRDEGEEGAIGILINIFNDDGEFVDSTRTTTGGFYSFTDLLGGIYYLVFDTEGDYVFTEADAGADDLDSDVTGENGEGSTASFVGTDKIKLDAGLILETGSYISGKVWGDTDEDNAYDKDVDIVFEGHEVFLVNRLARVIASTTTDTNGAYRFDLNESGEYAVFFETNDDITFVTANASGDDKTDSDVIEVITINSTFGTTDLIAFSGDQRIKNVDAGIVSTVEKAESITGVVWMDANEDGIRQTDESLLVGIEVKIFDSSDQLVATTSTDSDGVYTISDLESGDYYVQFTLDSGEFVAANQGDDDTIDSDVEDLENGNTATFTFESGTVQSFDAGVMGEVQINAICGTVWNDEDQNSLNNGEQGRRDIKVFLWKDNVVVDSTVTASDGTYNFANLESGVYVIAIEIVEGYTFVSQNTGDDDSIDSDVDIEGLSDAVTVDGKIIIDAGQYLSVQGITGKVWGDTNEDNVFGDEDILIEGHMVFLLNRTARVIQTVTTAADGTYKFEGVPAGMYAVFFDVGETDMFVQANATDDESKDSDVTEVITQIGPYAITPFFDYQENSSVRNIDAGLIRTPSSTGLVAGVVWLDSTEDGIRQDDEELFSGIDVTLFKSDGTEVAKATTDDMGAYLFTDVSPGEHYVVFTLLGREFVAANQGDDDRVDSDVEDLASGRTANFDVEIDVTVIMDAGILPAQTGVFGQVWFDFNENGQRDNDEMGIPNNEVKVFNTDGEEVGVTQTDSDGAYAIGDLENGNYYVQVFLVDAYIFTQMKVGDDATDSDITEANGDGTSDTFTFEGGLVQIDAGQISIVPSFISGTVWEDKDGDNTFNNDDDAVGGLNVYLQFDGVFIDTVLTEPDGTYTFKDVAVGKYFVHFEQPDGKFFTLANVPEEENKDSDVVGTVEIDGVSYGITEEVNIGSGQVKANVDAGITGMEINPGSISGQIWLDENDDAKNNEDEGPVEGVVVALITSTGQTMEMIDIPVDGTYKFENLVPGEYLLQFTIPAEYNFVNANQGEENEDSDVTLFDSPMGVTDAIVVGDGEDVVNIDAGLKPVTVNFSTIGDQVWLDVDEDGVLDSNEIGMNGVKVELYDADTDVLVSSMLTINHPELRDPGYYQFTELPDGDYYLRFELPNGYIFSNPRMGNETIKDSDVTGANGTGTTNTVTVDKVTMTDIDVGAFQTNKSIVGDFVFNDRNSNGIQDSDEDGINNIRVRIFDAENRQVAQTFTQYNRAMDRGGYFSFKVDPGTYYLRFDISQGLSFTEGNQGDNDERDSDVNGENGFGTTSLFEVELAETNLSLDAGLITEPANLGNYLWIDTNSNGVQDAGEDGLNGVEVSLHDKDHNLMISTTTATVNGQDGQYLFENISAGQYYVSFDLPDEYASTVANIGGNDAEDSDITDVFGKGTTSLFTLSSGEDELDIDGGVVLGSSIGDYVWEDSNGNGVQDNSESGSEGVFVKLLDETGTVIDTTRTDASGNYTFYDLRAGDYTLEFDLPIDKAVTSLNSGIDDDLDSDIDADGNSLTISVSYNETIDNVDLGLIPNTVAFNSGVKNELIAKVYPNPTMRFVTISTKNIYQDDTNIKEIQLFNSQGALVKSYLGLETLSNDGSNSYELDLEGVQPGVYYIKAKVGRLTYKKKLILINN